MRVLRAMALASQVLRSDGPLAKFPQNDGFWLGAVVAACLSGAFNVWAWRRVEMFPIPKENAQAAAKVGWLVASAWALLALFG